MGRRAWEWLRGSAGAWVARTQATWAARGAGARASVPPGRRIVREATLALGLAAAAAGVYGLMFVLARPAVPQRPPVSAPTRRGRAAAAPARTAAVSTTVARLAPGAAVTPPAAQSVAAQGPARAVSATVAPARAPGASAGASQAGARPQGGATVAPSATTAHSPGAAQSAGTAAGQSTGPVSPPPPLRTPVVGAVLAGFGWGYSPVFKDWQEHTGIDLAAPVGAAVAAPAAGVVLATRADRLWGWVVSIALGDGYSTNVSALASISVHPGQALRPGQTIGVVGASPPAEANLRPHVFWQLFAGSRPIDPLADKPLAG